jgi:PhoD-like phosphatase
VPGLVLGPLLRHIASTEATIWVETDAPCEVAVLGRRARTFAAVGRHYALLVIDGLEPGSETEYEVHLDGRRVWPDDESGFPPSVIRTVVPDADVRIAFGSCRASRPHEPPYTHSHTEHELGQGIDALRAMAANLQRVEHDAWPDAVLMLGDQIYADDLSPAMRELTSSRREGKDAPPDELYDFDEYAASYRESWSDPTIRWVLSTVPSMMIFDDHEIQDSWKTSADWLDRMHRKPWYARRIEDGLASYWVYQHIGNLSPAELRDDELFAEVQATDDAGDLLRERLANADTERKHSYWSVGRDLGRARILLIDSRAGRIVEPGERRLVPDAELEWVAEQGADGVEHLILASSVPMFLPHGLHHLEAAVEKVADGAWGERAADVGEKVRQAASINHWAAYMRSFRDLVDVLAALATGRDGPAPETILMLGGDVHHCYLAEIGFRPGTEPASAVWQIVCSGLRKDLAKEEKLAMVAGNSGIGRRVGHALARAAKVDDAPVGWRMRHAPTYDNQIATLELGDRTARVRVETTEGCDWDDPRLRDVFVEQLRGDA